MRHLKVSGRSSAAAGLVQLPQKGPSFCMHLREAVKRQPSVRQNSIPEAADIASFDSQDRSSAGTGLQHSVLVRLRNSFKLGIPSNGAELPKAPARAAPILLRAARLAALRAATPITAP